MTMRAMKILSYLMFVLLSACSGSSSDDPVPVIPPVSSNTVWDDSSERLYIVIDNGNVASGDDRYTTYDYSRDTLNANAVTALLNLTTTTDALSCIEDGVSYEVTITDGSGLETVYLSHNSACNNITPEGGFIQADALQMLLSLLVPEPTPDAVWDDSSERLIITMLNPDASSSEDVYTSYDFPRDSLNTLTITALLNLTTTTDELLCEEEAKIYYLSIIDSSGLETVYFSHNQACYDTAPEGSFIQTDALQSLFSLLMLPEPVWDDSSERLHVVVADNSPLPLGTDRYTYYDYSRDSLSLNAITALLGLMTSTEDLFCMVDGTSYVVTITDSSGLETVYSAHSNACNNAAPGRRYIQAGALRALLSLLEPT